jgi:hypothetical protein
MIKLLITIRQKYNYFVNRKLFDKKDWLRKGKWKVRYTKRIRGGDLKVGKVELLILVIFSFVKWFTVTNLIGRQRRTLRPA